MAATIEDTINAMTEAADVLTVLGAVKPVRTLEDRDVLVRQAVWGFVVGRMLPAIEQ